MASEQTAVTVIEGQARALETRKGPAETVAIAREQAGVLMKVVEEKHLYSVISGKNYLNAQAWETILAFNNAHPVTRFVEQLKDGDHCIGYRAQVDIYQHGELVSSGIMSCGFDEYPCRGKEGMAKHRAAESSAQTWALSKAARQKFAWVAVLAGFEPTPAEEMSAEETRQSADNPYWCREHKTLWFKRGKMTGFGHPVDGSKDWCHMPSEPKADSRPLDQSSRNSPDSPTQANSQMANPQKNAPDTIPMSKPSPTTLTTEAGAPPDDDGRLAYYDEKLAQARTAHLPVAGLPQQSRKNPAKVAEATAFLEQKLGAQQE